MSDLNLKGIWIPIQILRDDQVTDKEKIIYAIIVYLSKKNKYCFLTNKTISELLNISVTQSSNLINSLKKKGYIKVNIIYKENTKQIEMRKIIPLKMNEGYLRKIVHPIQEKMNRPIEEKFIDNKYNNKKINNKNKGEKKFYKNYVERDYKNYDFSILYANK